MPQAPVFIRLPPGRFILSNSTSPSCLGDADVESRTGQTVAVLLPSPPCAVSKSTDMRRRSSASTFMPARSMSSRTGIRRRSTCSYSASAWFSRSRGCRHVPQAQRDVGILGGVGGGVVDRHLCERHAIAPGAGDLVVADRRMAEMQPRQFVHAVAVRAGLLREGDQHGVVDRRDQREAGAAPAPSCRTWRSARFSAPTGSLSSGAKRGDRLAGKLICSARTSWRSGT